MLRIPCRVSGIDTLTLEKAGTGISITIWSKDKSGKCRLYREVVLYRQDALCIANWILGKKGLDNCEQGEE